MIAIFTRRHQGQDRGAGAEERREYGKAGTVCRNHRQPDEQDY